MHIAVHRMERVTVDLRYTFYVYLRTYVYPYDRLDMLVLSLHLTINVGWYWPMSSLDIYVNLSQLMSSQASIAIDFALG